MIDKSTAIVLAGTNAHIELINKLRSRGYYTILVDYNENPLAKTYADAHIRESTLDKETVLEIAKTSKAKLVISACVDQANSTACYVAETMGLPAPYSYETSIQVTNKAVMKKKMAQAGILTPKYLITGENKSFEDSCLNFPLVIKPVDSNGAKGVKKVFNRVQCKDAIDHAIKVSRSRKVIMEEFIEGDNVDLISFVRNGKAHMLMTRFRCIIKSTEYSAMQYYRSLIPAQISETAKKRMIDTATSIASEFGLLNTSLEVQFIVKNDDAYVIEFAPRVGGGLSFRTVPLITGFDTLEATIESYFGLQSKIEVKPITKYYSENNIYTKGGQFGHITGLDNLCANSVVDLYYYYKQKGEIIGSKFESKDRVGSFVASDVNFDELNAKLRKTIDDIQVFDIENKPIMCKKIYYDLHLRGDSLFQKGD